MKTRQFTKTLGTVVGFGAIVLALSNLSYVKAESEESRSRIGLKVAPVPLNMAGKDPELVGYGSYLVNVAASCNDCHSASPATLYAPGGNPYLGQMPAIVNQSTYLGGGEDFGAEIPGTPHIVSRNLTPDKTGLPVGGLKFVDFRSVIKTGVDLDKLHPTCTGAPDGSCLPPPFDGSVLQIMPWPSFSGFSDHDIRAIYEYLRAIPCVAGPPAPSPLHNECQ